MRILIIMDSIEQAELNKDTSVGFILAAQTLEYPVYYCNQEHLFVEDGRGAALCAPLRLHPDSEDAIELGPWAPAGLSEFDTIWMRKDPPVDRAYLHASHILDMAGSALVVNSPSGIRFANEKLYAQVFPEFCPPTYVSRDIQSLLIKIRASSQPTVVKPVDGHGGAGVFVLSPDDRNAASVLETLTENGRRWVVSQTYIPAARTGDKRIIMLNGELQGAIIRVPQNLDHRGNIHVGGTVQSVELTDRDLEICRAVGPRLRADGLWFVGLDIIGDYLTEINVTSPTGIREIQSLTGRDVGLSYVKWVQQQLK